MYYIIYKIINKINQKYYIGQHSTKDLNDGYLGSGKILKHAIKKYGTENFTKEILYHCTSEDELDEKEKEIVTIEFCLRDETYNICEGGFGGGFRYINRLGLNWTPEKNNRISGFKNISTEQRKKWYYAIDVEKRKENILKAALAATKSLKFLGKKHSEETKQKMRKPKNVGSQNSQFGSFWITNGLMNKKSFGIIPEGWRRGRNYFKNSS